MLVDRTLQTMAGGPELHIFGDNLCTRYFPDQVCLHGAHSFEGLHGILTSPSWSLTVPPNRRRTTFVSVSLGPFKELSRTRQIVDIML